MLSGLISSIRSSGKSLDNLEQLLIEELKDLYDAESQIIEALPKMIDAAHSPRVKGAFQNHLETTRQQRHRLEQIFRMMDLQPKGETCQGIRGIIEEAQTLMKASGNPNVRDAALVAAAQRVEHYEIAAYGACRTYARILRREDVANLLQQTLDEEGDTDKKLTEVALSGIDERAAGQ